MCRGHSVGELTQNCTVYPVAVSLVSLQSLLDYCRDAADTYGGKRLTGSTVWVYWWDQECVSEGVSGVGLCVACAAQLNCMSDRVMLQHISRVRGWLRLAWHACCSTRRARTSVMQHLRVCPSLSE